MGIDIKKALEVLIPIIACVYVIKGWKQGNWIEIIATVFVGTIAWSLVTGKNIFGMAWQIIQGLLKLIGVTVG